jgi:hypothetical protein
MPEGDWGARQSDVIETEALLCYMSPMTTWPRSFGPSSTGDGVKAHSTLAFAAIGDHSRLPSRFFPRFGASDGSLLRLD